MSVPRTCPTCGFTGTYATDGVADYHHSTHSCTRHLHLAELARRRAERAASGTRRNCRHKRTHHIHGTRAAYVKDRCRCRRCTRANTAESRTSHRERTYGRWEPYVDAGPARERILALREAGFGLRRIAKLANVSTTTLRAIIDTSPDGRMPRDKIRPETAEAILAVSTERASRAGYATVDPIGTRRRLQALIAIGWSLPQLAAHLDRTPAHLARTLGGIRVTIRTAEQVRALYDCLWDLRPPQDNSAARAAAGAARALAVQNGWLPPLAWDDIDNDPDPDPQHPDPLPAGVDDLDEIAIERAVIGDGIRLEQLTPAEQEEVVRQLTERGKSIRHIAGQLSTTKRTVSRRRRSAASAA
ncbi:helix-turn-helix domain containing protein [uncultured Jatrophihabitans sp.]|uniref:helix-turn-helix domain containing protein n=1 Tax=uncultured Jatrophihabitans sp. TaxID=1610747 RepID=UPI0035CC702B